MKNLKPILVATVALSFILASCHKDKIVTPVSVSATSGLYVLNQGDFGDNNSTLSFYNYTAPYLLAMGGEKSSVRVLNTLNFEKTAAAFGRVCAINFLYINIY